MSAPAGSALGDVVVRASIRRSSHNNDWAPDAELERLFPGNSEMARRMRTFDWSQSDVGDPQAWPENLRTAMRLCLTSRIPVVMYWGPNFNVLYNDPYISFLGDAKHPDCLGRP